MSKLKSIDLKREIARMWNMRTAQVLPIVVGSLGSVNKKLNEPVARTVGCQNWYFITPENDVTRNSKDFEKSIGAVE